MMKGQSATFSPSLLPSLEFMQKSVKQQQWQMRSLVNSLISYQLNQDAALLVEKLQKLVLGERTARLTAPKSKTQNTSPRLVKDNLRKLKVPPNARSLSYND